MVERLGRRPRPDSDAETRARPHAGQAEQGSGRVPPFCGAIRSAAPGDGTAGHLLGGRLVSRVPAHSWRPVPVSHSPGASRVPVLRARTPLCACQCVPGSTEWDKGSILRCSAQARADRKFWKAELEKLKRGGGRGGGCGGSWAPQGFSGCLGPTGAWLAFPEESLRLRGPQGPPSSCVRQWGCVGRQCTCSLAPATP